MRYKLRSATKSDSNESNERPSDRSTHVTHQSVVKDPVQPGTSKSDSGGPPEKKARLACRRKIVHKLQTLKSGDNSEVKDLKSDPNNSTTILNLGVDIVLYLAKYLDASSLICLYRSCHFFYDMLRHSGTFWKLVCQKEELANYECLTDKENEHSEDFAKVGWTGKPMRIRPPDDYESWRKVYLRGLEMRRNIISGNFEGWRIYANSEVPVAKLTPDLDLNEVKKDMGEFAKLSVNGKILSLFDFDDIVMA